MTYVDAVLNREKNQIEVVERVKGKRVYKTYPTKYVMYWPSERGKYTSIFGTKLDKFETTRADEFARETRMVPREKQYESDLNVIFRCFYDHYRDAPSPNLHVAFFDIETDFNKELGFSSAEEAFNAVTAISIYCNWLDCNFTLVLKPKELSQAEAEDIVAKFDDTLLCENEYQLLDLFLKIIEDADILSGWNSEGYDIPYLHNRIVQILGKEHCRRMCLWNKLPKKREYESYGRNAVTYDLVGRVHLDYLQLYRKHTYHEMHSYRLDFVGEYEVGDKKVAYEGSLDTLYNQDFEKFIAYNRQDVMLLVKIDAKNKFIELSNNLAHENCVLLATTMGAVALIDQAIVNEAHNLGLIVPNRQSDKELDENRYVGVDGEEGATKFDNVVGAYVADPKKGLHEWIGGVDINSLYPSTIRALNMSPETIVGQIRPESTDKLITKRVKVEKKTFADAWNNMFGLLEYNQVLNQELVPITVDFEDGSTTNVSAVELYRLVFESGKGLILSANGTIFSTEKKGVIPGLLARWYSERKSLQAEMRRYGDLAGSGLKLDDELAQQVGQILSQLDGDNPPTPQSLDNAIKNNDATAIAGFVVSNGLELNGVKIVAVSDEAKDFCKRQRDFYDQRQLIKKILLNSLYGALGNQGSRMFDARIAQSVTLSGRCIVKHMQSKINEIIAGKYDYLGESCIYGDSVTGDTLIKTDGGEITIEQLFNECVEHSKTSDGKEYGLWSQARVIGFSAHDMEPQTSSIEYVMRHNTKKKLYRITTDNGKQVTVTEDHSIMVDRDGFLIEVKPNDIQPGDNVITLVT